MAFEHDLDSNNDDLLLGEQRGERGEKLARQSFELRDPLSFFALFFLYPIQHVLQIVSNRQFCLVLFFFSFVLFFVIVGNV